MPDLSFAGQQDTFLNVAGVDALLCAVVGCWSSLWTARAIGYRARNDIATDGVSLAVVVQTMAAADAAGVLFTANPLTGRRGETVIDATLGLGEALVSGQVEPDHYVVETGTGRIVEKWLGSKGSEANRAIQALPDEVIGELTALGAEVAVAFGAPQDIEWTWGEGKLALVQSRPITSLYPLPEGQSDADLRVLGSFGAFQGVLAPFTPFGQDALAALVAKAGQFFGYNLTYQTQGVLLVAGERLWIDLTGILRNGFGRKLAIAALGQVEPAIGEVLAPLLDLPELAVRAERPGFRAIRRVIPAFLPAVPRIVRTLARPDASRVRMQQALERGVAEVAAKAAAARTLSDRLDLLDEATRFLPEKGFPLLLPVFPPGMAMLYQLTRVASGMPGGRELALEVTCGLPHNVTTEMDLQLWHAAQRIQADPPSLATAQSQSSAELAAAFLAGDLPAVARVGARRLSGALRDAGTGRDRPGAETLARGPHAGRRRGEKLRRHHGPSTRP